MWSSLNAMIRLPLLALALVAAAEVTAQPSLVVSADTIRYPAETTFTATNAGPDSLILSFPVTEEPPLYGTTGAYGWYFEIETPDSLYDFVFLPFDEPPSMPLAPSASATFHITGFDPCPVCAAKGGGGLPADTLYLRSADASGADTAHVVLDLAGYVSVEPSAPMAATLRVSTYPNPARHTLTVVVKSERSAEVALIVVDALGREVRRLNRVPATGQAFSLPLGGLPAGAYALQAKAPGLAPATKQFVVVR